MKEKQQNQSWALNTKKNHQLCDWVLNDALHLHIEPLYTNIQDLLPTGQSAFTESTGIFPPTVKVSSLFTNLCDYIAI